MSNEPRRAGRHFLQIPGPTPVPDRILRAMDMPVIDHRGPEFKKLGLRVLAGIKTIFKTSQPGGDLPSSGTGAWEAALLNTLSPGDKVLMYETGHFATLWKTIAVKLGLRAGVHRLRLAQRRRCRRHRSAPARGQGPRHQGRVRGAQRDLDGRDLAHRRGAQGHRCGQASRAADGGYDLFAGLDRLSPRRVGRGRHRRRIAEGADAAAGPRLQCREPEGAGRKQDEQAAQVLFRLGRDDRLQQGRLLPLHAGDQPAVRPGRGRRHAARGRPRPRVRPARPARRGRAPRGEGVGAGDPVQGPEVLFVGADGRRHARGAQRRQPAQDGARSLRRVAGHRARQGGRQGVPHRPSGRHQRPDRSSPRWPAWRWRCRSATCRTSRAAWPQPWTTSPRRRKRAARRPTPSRSVQSR